MQCPKCLSKCITSEQCDELSTMEEKYILREYYISSGADSKSETLCHEKIYQCPICKNIEIS
jgi:hypothetical protein